MAKKNFIKSIGSKNLSSLIPTEEPKEEEKKGRGVTQKKKTAIPKPKKEAIETTVTTFRVNNAHLKSIKAIAFWERKKIQDIFNGALESYLNAIPESTLKKARTEYEKRQS